MESKSYQISFSKFPSYSLQSIILYNFHSRRSSNPLVMEDNTEQCDHCHKRIELHKIDTHYSYCRRNFKACDECHRLYDINYRQEHVEQYHNDVVCQNCGKKMKMGALENHRKQCGPKTMLCPYCDLQVPEAIYQTHSESCGGRTATCSVCYARVPMNQLDLHERKCFQRLSMVVDVDHPAEGQTGTRRNRGPRSTAVDIFHQPKPISSQRGGRQRNSRRNPIDLQQELQKKQKKEQNSPQLPKSQKNQQQRQQKKSKPFIPTPIKHEEQPARIKNDSPTKQKEQKKLSAQKQQKKPLEEERIKAEQQLQKSSQIQPIKTQNKPQEIEVKASVIWIKDQQPSNIQEKKEPEKTNISLDKEKTNKLQKQQNTPQLQRRNVNANQQKQLSRISEVVHEDSGNYSDYQNYDQRDYSSDQPISEQTP